MEIRARLLVGSFVFLGAAALIEEGCGGKVLGGGATCASVCANIAPCIPSSGLDPNGPSDTLAECTSSCDEAQADCSGSGMSDDFQSSLDCLANLSCSDEATLLEGAMSCAAGGGQCGISTMPIPQPVPLEVGTFDAPPIELDGSFDTTPFDVTPIPPFDSGTDAIDESTPEPPFDSATDSPLMTDAPFEASGHG
jgi:hypothetical protein